MYYQPCRRVTYMLVHPPSVLARQRYYYLVCNPKYLIAWGAKILGRQAYK